MKMRSELNYLCRIPLFPKSVLNLTLIRIYEGPAHLKHLINLMTVYSLIPVLSIPIGICLRILAVQWIIRFFLNNCRPFLSSSKHSQNYALILYSN